ncbi:MAG: hypothetical protein AAB777_01990, partial [Patescibacteria group bacterium]
MGLFGPEWWHHHGIKIRVTYKDAKAITMEGSAARLIIWLANPGTKCPWSVEWRVIHSQTEQVNGVVRFSVEELLTAFGTSVIIQPSHSQWMVDVYGAECAFQGKYIRTGDFLNIPCPGTGHDGDPNISIELDDEIRDAVGQLIGK